jgi:alkaline phosphatase
MKPIIKNMERSIAACLLLLVISWGMSCSPAKKYSVANAHSHNDYLNPNPFFSAFDEGFGSIEADVFPVNGDLYVAHKKEEIQAKNKLGALYLEPLLGKITVQPTRKVNLLIDIKENYQQALGILAQELKPLMNYLSTPGNPKNITISISGERPPPSEYSNYPNFIFFDDDLKRVHSSDQWQRVNLVSLPFDKISKWKGAGPVPHKDLQVLRQKIDSVHSAGKPIRFWAAPDNTEAWKQQEKLGVDLIGTDKISEFANFLRGGAKNSITRAGL